MQTIISMKFINHKKKILSYFVSNKQAWKRTHCATSNWSLSQAACRGEPLQAVRVLGLAPCSRRDRTSSKYPRQQAQYSAVPSFLAVCEFKHVNFLCANNFLASVTSPLRIASINDIAISLSLVLLLQCKLFVPAFRYTYISW